MEKKSKKVLEHEAAMAKLSEEKEFEVIQEEINKRTKERRRAVIDQVLRFLGLVLATVIFLVSFSFLSPLTFFAGIFGFNASEVWTNGALGAVFEPGTLYHLILYDSPFMAILVMTMIQVSLAFVLAFLISYYIRDLFAIIRSILEFGKDITQELGTNIKEGVVDEFADAVGITKIRKKLFENEEEAKKPSPKRGRPPKKAEVTTVQSTPTVAISPKAELSDEELDRMLMDPNYKPQSTTQTTQSESIKKSLFKEE